MFCYIANLYTKQTAHNDPILLHTGIASKNVVEMLLQHTKSARVLPLP